MALVVKHVLLFNGSGIEELDYYGLVAQVLIQLATIVPGHDLHIISVFLLDTTNEFWLGLGTLIALSTIFLPILEIL